MEANIWIRFVAYLREKYEKSHRQHVTSRHYWQNVFIGLTYLSGALVLNFYAGQYATIAASNSVTDIVLSHTKVYDVDGVFTYGALMFVIYIAALCFWHPGKTPFILKSISLFVLVRSISISLTHIGPFPTHVTVSLSNFLRDFIFSGDLFFSGHTGLPFLMALIFWKNRIIRTLCVATAVMFGIIVLLGHLHYSIDVFSAFFITYSIYRIAKVVFKSDYELAKRS